MKTSVIITDSKNSNNLARSLISLIEAKKKPDNVCMVFNENISDNLWGTAKAIMGGCCGSKPPDEVIKDGTTIVSGNKYDINFFAIKLSGQLEHELKNYAINLLKDSTDIFFTQMVGTIFSEDYIQKHLDSYSAPVIKAVYSDYIEGTETPKEKFLSSFNAMMTGPIATKEISFRNSGITFNGDNFRLLSEIYANGIIKHIPEFLFIT